MANAFSKGVCALEFAFVIIAYLVQALVFGFIASYIASCKGYTTGFAWGFFLGVVGLLVVGFRPTLSQPAAEYKPMYPEQQPQSNASWECICGASNPATLDYCLSCRRPRNSASERLKIACPHCGAMNTSTNDTCFACSRPLHAESPALAAPAPAGNAQDIPALIESLAKLHSAGVLTGEEFAQKKSELLAKI